MRKYALGESEERPWGSWSVVSIGIDYVLKLLLTWHIKIIVI